MDKVERLESEIDDALRDHERYKGYVSIQRYRSNMKSIQAKRVELKELRQAELENIQNIPVSIVVHPIPARVPFRDYLQNVVCYRCNKKGHYAPSCRVKDGRAILQEKQKLERALQQLAEEAKGRERERDLDRKKIMENYSRYYNKGNGEKGKEEGEARKKRRLDRVLKNLS